MATSELTTAESIGDMDPEDARECLLFAACNAANKMLRKIRSGVYDEHGAEISAPMADSQLLSDLREACYQRMLEKFGLNGDEPDE